MRRAPPPTSPVAPVAASSVLHLPSWPHRRYATGTDSLTGEVRVKYFTSLLASKDPDDKEHACLAIASIAQDSPANREVFFNHGISGQVLEVLLETCRQQMPRQRLQRLPFSKPPTSRPWTTWLPAGEAQAALAAAVRKPRVTSRFWSLGGSCRRLGQEYWHQRQ